MHLIVMHFINFASSVLHTYGIHHCSSPTFATIFFSFYTSPLLTLPWSLLRALTRFKQRLQGAQPFECWSLSWKLTTPCCCARASSCCRRTPATRQKNILKEAAKYMANAALQRWHGTKIRLHGAVDVL